LGGDTPNIAIGQGYNLLTPLQMATLYSAIANGGKVFKPYIVKNVATYDGKSLIQNEPQLLSEASGITPEAFALVRKYLESVVMEPDGTGKNASVPGQTVAGKTGSAQVVSLRKNANNKNDDVSVKWKEHAIFAAFSPSENAEIAIAVVSENDAFGGGGAQAAPIAGKILNAYWDLKKKRASAILEGVPPLPEPVEAPL
jgi:penicillin-binding protein 2